MLLLTDAKQVLAWLRFPLTLSYTNASKRMIPSTDKVSKLLEQRCLEHAWRLYPLATVVQPLAQQGGCSYTLIVTFEMGAVNDLDETGASTVILQFRPRRFALDLALCRRAYETYGSLVPLVTSRDPLANSYVKRDLYEMSLVPGVRFDTLQHRQHHFNEDSMQKFQLLLQDLASYFAASFRASDRETNRRQCTGKIGSSLVSRLQKLSLELQSPALCARARATLSAVRNGALDSLPVVLTHGDLLPSNIMIDPASWQLTGLVDWAEAEDLPFGIGLYGVEHLFGYLEEGRWVWYDQAEHLRAFFWERLVEDLSELKLGGGMESVLVAKEIGILLWHGLAWDDGRIDRVVDEEDDREEVEMLRAFLDVSGAKPGGEWKCSGKRDSKLDIEC